MRTVYSIALLCAVCLVATVAAIDVFGPADVSRAAAAIAAAQGKDGLFTDNAQAIQALRALSQSVPNADKACTATKAAFGKAKKSVSAIYEATQAITALKSCTGVSLSADQKAVVQRALDSGLLDDIYDAVFTAIPLIDAKLAAVTDFDFSKVVPAVELLQEEDGTYRSDGSAEGGNAVNAGLALQIIGSVAKAVPSVAKKNADAIESAAAKVERLMEIGGVDADFTADSEASPVEAASTVLVGIQSLGAVVDTIEVTEAQISKLCNQLLDNKYVRDVVEVYHLVRGLRVCADNVVHVPLAVQLTDATPAKLRVRVTNVLDGFASPATVTIASASAVGETASVLKDIALTAGSGSENTEYTVKGDNKLVSAKPGVYNVRFSVTPTGADERVKKQDKIVKRVRVLADVTGVQAGVWLSDSAKSQSTDETVLRATYPATLPQALSASATQHLYAEFTLTSAAKDFQPSQVFLQLCKAGTSNCAIYPARPKSDKYDGKFTAKINLGASDVVEALYGAGDYDIQVVIGDALLVKSLKWKIGSVAIKYTGEDAKDRHTDPFATQPEIAHKFRPAETRPPAIIAWVFSAASLLPLVILLAALASFNPKISWPTDAHEGLMSLIFQGSIAAILVTYIWYWLALNIFQALSIVSLLGLVAIFAGNQSLRLLNKRKALAKEHEE